MGADLAGQNDTSYQRQPTGLLHGDKLHLHFHSLYPPTLTFKFVYSNIFDKVDGEQSAEILTRIMEKIKGEFRNVIERLIRTS